MDKFLHLDNSDLLVREREGGEGRKEEEREEGREGKREGGREEGIVGGTNLGGRDVFYM